MKSRVYDILYELVSLAEKDVYTPNNSQNSVSHRRT